MVDNEHPTLVHRIRRYRGPILLCEDGHSFLNKEYCTECEIYTASEGCHSRVYVYADGACSHNGYPDARSGIGVYFGPGSSYNVSQRLNEEDHHTSQRAELQAAIKAFEIAIDIVEETDSDYSLISPNYWRRTCRLIVLLTDSAYVCNGLNSWMDDWEENDWTNSRGNPIANQDLFERLHDLKYESGRAYELKSVRIGREYNQRADALAKQSLSLPGSLHTFW